MRNELNASLSADTFRFQAWFVPISQTDEAAVGHRIMLKGSLMDGSRDISNTVTKWQWAIEGDAIADYVVTQLSGTVEPLKEELAWREIPFYWTTGAGARRITLTAWVQQKQYVKQETITIYMPTAIKHTSKTTNLPITIGNRIPPGAPEQIGDELYYGNPDADPPSPGINWTGEAKFPQVNSPGLCDGRGWIFFRQLAKTDRLVIYPAGVLPDGKTKQIANSAEKWWIDGGPVYANLVRPFNAGADATITIGDSPGNPAQRALTTKANDDFQNFLMYRPAGLRSIEVPLKLLTWDFKAMAARPTEKDSWPKPSLPSDPTKPPAPKTDPEGVPTTTIPEWSGATDDPNNVKFE